MKSIKVTLVVLSTITSNNIIASTIKPIWIEESSIAPISAFTNAVLNHYYTIARLKNAIALLKKIPQKLIASLSFDQLPEFTHPDIIQCINEIKKKHTFQPLFNHWQTIITYKSAEDDEYITQYCTLILYLMTIVTNETMYCYTKQCTPHTNSKKHSGEIAFRFFLIHRLQNTYNVLQKCKKLSMITYRQSDINAVKKNIDFTDPYICSCITKTATNGSLIPTIHLFDLFNNYRFIDNPVFVKEFLSIIFITLRTIKKYTLLQSSPSTVDIVDIMHNYHNFLKPLSLEEILNIIEMETKEISTFNKNH